VHCPSPSHGKNKNISSKAIVFGVPTPADDASVRNTTDKYRAWEQRCTPVTGSQPSTLIIPFESDSLGLDEQNDEEMYDSRNETGGPCATQSAIVRRND
jgi:hypothetical protein